MKKIPTLFRRDPADMSRVLPEVNPGCEWVLAGEGKATRKMDGTCCLVDAAGGFWKRREVKGEKPDPAGFIEADRDPITRKRVGWVPVGDGPEDRYYREAFDRPPRRMIMDFGDSPIRRSYRDSDPDDSLPYRHDQGTYELLGPRVQGNPEKLEEHFLERHSEMPELPDAPRDFDGLRSWLEGRDIEGIVWHHPDGRMAKIKLRDFGLKRVRRHA